jgi:hypothetical protein
VSTSNWLVVGQLRARCRSSYAATLRGTSAAARAALLSLRSWKTLSKEVCAPLYSCIHAHATARALWIPEADVSVCMLNCARVSMQKPNLQMNKCTYPVLQDSVFWSRSYMVKCCVNLGQHTYIHTYIHMYIHIHIHIHIHTHIHACIHT